MRVQTAPIEVKKVARFVDKFCNACYFLNLAYSQTSVYYICSGCQSFHEQPLGRMTERINDRSGNTTVLFKSHVGPPVPEKCPECGSPLHIAGPMWNGQIHDPQFVSRILEHLESDEDKYGTFTRMKGMLTVAKEVGTPSHFCDIDPTSDRKYKGAECTVLFHAFKGGKFFPLHLSLIGRNSVSGWHMCGAPLSLCSYYSSALLHAGHQVSRSHAAPGSLKTTATRQDLHDVYRTWVKKHPVKMEKIPPNSPARVLLQQEPRYVPHPPRELGPADNITNSRTAI